MHQLTISQTGFDRMKRYLRDDISKVPSAHRTETAARGLGFGSNAALRARLVDGPATAALAPAAFDAYLSTKGFHYLGDGFVTACAAEAIRAVSAGQPTLGPNGFLALRDASKSDEDYREYLDWVGPALLERRMLDGFVVACRHLGLPYRRASLAGTHRAESLTKTIQDSEGIDLSVGTLIAACIHLGFPVALGSNPTRGVRITVPGPSSGTPHAEAWVSRAVDEGEAMKNDGRKRLNAALSQGRFDAGAAEDVIKALWARAFCSKLDLPGIPSWQSYARMLIADPEISAVISSSLDAASRAMARRGIEALCGGGPLPGLKPGYTYVFEGPLQALLERWVAA